MKMSNAYKFVGTTSQAASKQLSEGSAGLSGMSRRGFLAAGAVAAGSLALTACGTKGASTTNTGSAAGSASGAALTKLTFCLDYTPNTNHTGVYVAAAKGFFTDEGLEVEIVQPAEDGADAMIGTGQAQFGVSYQDFIANDIVGGNTGITAIAAVIQHNTSGIMTRKEDNITSPKALENHTYTTWEMPIEQATMKQVVEKDGGDWSKVKQVPYTTDDDVAGLQSKMYDAVWVYEGWAVQQAALQKVDVNYFSFISIDETFDFYTPVIAGNVEYMKAHPEVAKAFLRAVKKGYEFCVEHADEAAEILCEQVPELKEDLVKMSQEFLADQYIADATSWGAIDPARWSSFFTWLNDNQLVEKELDVNTGFDTSYLEA